MNLTHPLAEMRKKAGITRYRLAIQIGENNGYITMVEQFKKKLSVSASMKIADVLECDGALLHYEVLVAQSLHLFLKGYRDDEIDTLDINEIIKIIARVANKKHAYLMAEYYEMKELHDSILYGGMRKKNA